MNPASAQISSKKPLLKTGGQLRIIGGSWRGRKLHFPAVDGLRPTGDRVRETLFNWLAPEIQGARCLDLFAGSGALGIEALSRGAERVVMLEQDAKATAQLRANLSLLGAENGTVIHGDTVRFLQQTNSLSPKPQEPYRQQLYHHEPYHIVFMDPPFQKQLWQQAIDLLETEHWLADDATIYIESNRDSVYNVPPNWLLHREKYAGNISYRLYYRERV